MKYIKLFEEKYEYFDLMTMGSGELIELLKLEIEKEDYDIEYIKEIIEWGHFNIDALWYDKENGNWTFLMKATYLNRLDIVKALLDGGANPNTQTDDKYTALIIASGWEYFDIIKELLNHPDINPNLQNMYGVNALMKAINNRIMWEIEELLKHPDIDITLIDQDDRTAWDRASDEIRERFPELNPNRQ